MADLAELKALGDELVPILKKLFDNLEAEVAGDAEHEKAVDRLKKVTAESNQPTPGELLQRAQAVIAAREALTEIIEQANARPDSVKGTTLRIVDAQHTALGASFGRLLELSAFAAIPSLLSQGEIKTIEDNLTQASQEIKQRQRVKKRLALFVDVALMGGKIAARLG